MPVALATGNRTLFAPRRGEERQSMRLNRRSIPKLSAYLALAEFALVFVGMFWLSGYSWLAAFAMGVPMLVVSFAAFFIGLSLVMRLVERENRER